MTKDERNARRLAIAEAALKAGDILKAQRRERVREAAAGIPVKWDFWALLFLRVAEVALVASIAAKMRGWF